MEFDPTQPFEEYVEEPGTQVEVLDGGTPPARGPLAVPFASDDPGHHIEPPSVEFDPTQPFEEVTTLEEDVGEVGTGINIGISELAGAPADFFNWVLSGVGLDTEAPVGGSESIRNLFEDIGVIGEETNSMKQRIGKEVGMNVMGYGVAGAFARTARTGGIFKPMLDTIRKSPLGSLLADLGISIPSGAGAHIGREFDEDIGGSGTTGEIIGQFTGALGPTGLLYRVAGLPGKAFRGFKSIDESVGITSRGTQRAAADKVRGAMERPESEITLATDPHPEFGMPTTGELLDDPGLMNLQRALDKKNSGAAQMRERSKIESVRGGLEKLPHGDPAKARGAFEQKQRKAVADIENRLARELKAIQAKIDKMSTDELPSTVEKVARDGIDRVYKIARLREGKLWKQSGVEEFDIKSVRAAADDVIASMTKSDDPIHPIVARLANKQVDDEIMDEFGTMLTPDDMAKKGQFGDIETLREVDGLKQKLGEIAATEKAAGRNGRAFKINQLQDALYNESVPLTKGGEDALARSVRAREFSVTLNDTFTRGPIGNIRGVKPNRDLKVSPEQTLTKILPGKSKSVAGVEAMRKAATEYGSGTESVDKLVRRYILARYAIDGPAVLRQQKEMLTKFYPELLENLNNAELAKKLIKSVDKNYADAVNRAKNATVLSEVISGDTTLAIDAALKATNPAKEIKKLARIAGRHSQEAFEGLQGAFHEHMMSTVAPRTSDAVSDVGVAVRAKLLSKFIKQYGEPIRTLYGESGLKLMKSISRGADIASRTATGPGVGQSEVSDILLRVAGNAGTVIGSKYSMGTHQLLAAGMAKFWSQRIVGKILDGETERVFNLVDKALKDPALAKLLLKKFPAKNQPGLSKSEMSLADYAVVQDIISNVTEKAQEEQ
jgi:hypothetical protein